VHTTLWKILKKDADPEDLNTVKNILPIFASDGNIGVPKRDRPSTYLCTTASRVIVHPRAYMNIHLNTKATASLSISSPHGAHLTHELGYKCPWGSSWGRQGQRGVRQRLYRFDDALLWEMRRSLILAVGFALSTA
jgi:hypothetical protein